MFPRFQKRIQVLPLAEFLAWANRTFREAEDRGAVGLTQWRAYACDPFQTAMLPHMGKVARG
jgi:hypothetical protein